MGIISCGNYILPVGILRIKRLFGQHDNAITLLEILRNSVRLSRLREQKQFLVSCRRYGLTPLFILNCVRLPTINCHSRASESHIARFQKTMLNDSICSIHSQIAFYTREARRTPDRLQSVPFLYHPWFLRLCADACRYEACESRNRLQRKLHNLQCRQNQSPEPEAEVEATALRVNNCCSSQTFTNATLSLLSKGPKFAVTPGVSRNTIRDVELGVERMAYSLRWKKAKQMRWKKAPAI